MRDKRETTFRVPLGASFELRGSAIAIIPNRSSTLIGVARDRPVVGYYVVPLRVPIGPRLVCRS